MTHRYLSTETVVSKYIRHSKEGSEVKQHIMPRVHKSPCLGRRGVCIFYGRAQHVSFQYGKSFMSSFASLEV